MEENPIPLPLPPEFSQPQVGGIINPPAVPTPSSLADPLRLSPVSTGVSQGQVGSSDIFGQINDFLGNQNNFNREWAPYTKIGSYDADYTGTNFDRYYNVPDVYNSVGFSPFRNNEQIYNNNMSWWDGFKRSSEQSLVQASVSFKGALPWNAWDGDYQDIEGAKRVERSSAIGQDTRGGFGSWVNNTMMNFGFTYGILTEIAAEELALFGMSFIPGMQGISGVRSLYNAKRLKDLARTTQQVGRAVEATARTAQAIDDANKIRKIWSAAKAAKLPRVFLGNTMGSLQDIYKGVRRGDALYSLANASKAFGGFYRDAREISLALSESKLEAGMVELDMKHKLTDSFYAREGRMPGYQEGELIQKHASDAAYETFLWNMPVIYLSNKLVLDKALRGFLPSRVVRNELTKGLYGKLKFNELWRKTGGDPISIIQKSTMESVKKLFKPRMWNAKNLTKDFAGGLLLYSKANIMEGSQELFQETIAPAMQNYYTYKYNNPQVWAARSKWGDFYESGKKLMGSQMGLEVFASGFVMGGMAQFPQHVMFQYLPEKFYAVTDKEGYKKYIDARKDNTKRVVEALNHIIKADPDKYFGGVSQNGAVQTNLDNDAHMANQVGDRLTYNDVIDESIGEHVYTLVHHGKIDLLKTVLGDMRNLTPKEMEEAFGPVDASQGSPAEHYSKQIDKFDKYIDRIESRYEEYNNMFFNPFDHTTIDREKDPELFNETLHNQISFERWKKLAVLSDFHFGRTADRMASIYKKWLATPEMGNMLSTDLSLLFSIDPKFARQDIMNQMFNTGTGSLADEIIRLRRDVGTLEKAQLTTEEGKKELKQAKRQLELLENFNKLVNTQYLTLLKEIKQARAQGNEEEAVRKEEAVEGVVRRLKDVYTDYLMFVAEKSGLNKDELLTVLPDGTKILNANLDDAFLQLKDFYTLHSDRSDLIQAINMLHNPDIMLAGVRAGAKVVELERTETQKRLAEWYDKFNDNMDGNTILDELSKAGVFFDPAHLDDFKNGKLDNIVFYFHTGKDFIDVRDLQEPTFTTVKNAIETVLDKYSMMKSLSGRPLFEYRPEGGYTHRARGKMVADKRTLAELAAEFGFNVSTAETQIPIRQVLQKIIDSKYSTPGERLLAKKLMSLVPEVMSVRFRTGQQVPGAYSEAAGIVIDPRYSSSDFAKGVDPIELVILQQISKYILEDAIKNDNEFKAKITDMLKAAREFQINNATEFSRMIGLKDELEFVANALSNPQFQTMLSRVKYQVTGKSTWQEFMEAVRDFILKVFKVTPREDTVLEEAMYVITSKLGTEPITPGGAQPSAGTVMQKVGTSGYRIDSGLVFYENADGTLRPVENPDGKTPIEAIKDDMEKRRQTDLNTDELYQAELDSLTARPGAAPGKRSPLTHLSPIENLKPIWDKLLASYKDSEERREKDGYSPLTIGWRSMQDNEILNSEGFRKFLDTKPALDIIDAYNVAEGLVPKTVGGSNFTDKLPTMEQREKLKALGWTPEQIAKMRFLDAEIIISEGRKGTDPEEDREGVLRELERQRMENVKKDFYDSYNAIDPQAEGARQQLFDWLASVKEKDRLEDYLTLGINSTLWEQMFNDKLAELPKIDALEIGKVYKVDGVFYKVRESRDLVYYLDRFDELGLPEEQRSTPLAIPRADLNRLNIVSAQSAELPTVVTSEDAAALDKDKAEGLSAEDKAAAQQNASANPNDINFDPCG